MTADAHAARPLVLIVCRDAGGLPALRRVDPKGRHVLASDDPRVRAAAAKLPGIESVVFLEKMESLFAVADDVLRTLGQVNAWLTRVGAPNDVRSDLLAWVSHAEGGITTQRIQDCYLLLRSFADLIERHAAAKIALASSGADAWIDDLLEAYAADARIPFERWRGGARAEARRLARRTWQRWRPAAKEIYLSSEVVRAWRRDPIDRLPVDPPTVAVQLCDSAAKHVNTVRPLLRALNDAGVDGVVVGWMAGPRLRELRAEGIATTALETWVSPGALARSWIATARAWRRARAALPSFLPARDDAPHERIIRSVLVSSLRAFFIGEVPQRVRLDAAARRFFSAHPPRAARLWTRVLPQGAIAYGALPRERRPLLFWQPGWPYNVREPLRSYTVPADLVFALSGEHRRRLVADGVNENDVVVAGLPWLEGIRSFAASHTKADSRKVIGLAREADLYVMFDPGYVLRGYKTMAEQMTVVSALLDLAAEHEELELIIKPHPAHAIGALEAVVAERALANVICLPPSGPTYHAMNASDVVVTKYSTVAVEAMCLEVPTICAILDQEREFALYEDAAAYAFSVEELTATLRGLIASAPHREEWRMTLRERSREFLRRHELDVAARPNDVIAAELKQRIVA